MSNISEKLITIAENTPKVYYSGKMNVVKSSDYLKGSESGSSILVEDVSPVTHEMEVRVRSKNLFEGTLNSGIYESENFKISIADSAKYKSIKIYLPVGTYTLSSSVSLMLVRQVVDGVYSSIAKSGNTYTFSVTVDGDVGFSFRRSDEADWDDSDNVWLNEGTTATPYTPYVPDLTAVKVSRFGKNILEYPYIETTLTRNGITFTDNGDGTITANGTATADAQFKLQDTVSYPDNYNPFKYLIDKIIGVTGSPDGSSKDTYAIQSIQTGNYGNTGFTITNSNRYRFAIFIKSGITVNNLVFKPMIYLRGVTNFEFEQYSKTDYTPTADGTVNGVSSLYPTTLTTDTDGVLIDCDYYKDIDKAFNELTTSVALSGGE